MKKQNSREMDDCVLRLGRSGRTTNSTVTCSREYRKAGKRAKRRGRR